MHRDIKPQNILLSTSGVVKILDLGLARVQDEPTGDQHTSLTQEGTMMGTVDYMSPEQARDSRVADGRSDVYSLGATLYYLLVGRPPFAGGAPIEKLHRLANEAPPPLSQFRIDCPPELAATVERMLAKRPEERFRSTVEVIRALRPFAAERIAGRPAVTAAVQSAADTIHIEQAEPTAAELLFNELEQTAFSSAAQRRAATPTASRRENWKFGLILSSLILAVIAAGWSLNGRSKSVLPDPTKLQDSDGKAKLAGKPASPVPQNIRRVLHGHYGGIRSLAWSPNGRYIATGGGDGEVRVRDPVTLKTIAVYDQHHGAVWDVVWSPDGTLIASADCYGEIHVWQVASGVDVARLRRRFSGGAYRVGNIVGAIAIAPDNREMAYEEVGKVVRYSLQEARQIGGSGGGGARLCYSPSGAFLASSAGPIVWDTRTGEQVFGSPTGTTPGAPGDDIIPGFASDDTLVVIETGVARLWNCRAGELIREIKIAQAVEQATGSGKASPLASIAPDGSVCRILTATERIDISLPDGILSAQRYRTPLAAWAGAAVIGNVMNAWDINVRRGVFAYSGMNGGGPHLMLYDMESGELAEPFGVEARPGSPWEIRLSGHRLLFSGFPGSCACWDLQSGMPAEGLSRNGCLIDENRVRCTKEDRVVTRPVAGGYAENDLRSVPLEDLADEQAVWPMLQFTDDAQTIWAPAAGGQFQAGIGIIGNGVRFWNAETGEFLKQIDFPPVTHGMYFVNLHPNLMAMTSHYGSPEVRWWRFLTDEPMHSIPFTTTLYGSAISFDGSRLAARGHDIAAGTATIWSLTEGRRLCSISTGYDPQIEMPHFVARFTPSAKNLLVTRKIWDVSVDRPKLVWECPERDHAIGSNLSAFRWGELFPDERHVLIVQDAQFQICDWRENKKLATLFLLPGDEAVFVNHLTGHFSGSSLAHQYLRTEFDRQDGRPAVEVTIREFERATGWKNDPKKAGLDLTRRNRELGEKANAD